MIAFPKATPHDPIALQRAAEEAVKLLPEPRVIEKEVIREVPISPGVVKSNKDQK